MDYGHWNVKCDEVIDAVAFVYQMTDENGKKYIGARTMQNKWRRYSSSSNPVREAIKNGVKFSHDILKFFTSVTDAFDYEANLIVQLNCTESDDYYNLYDVAAKFNFYGRTQTEEAKAKIGAHSKGKVLSDEHKAKLRKPKANVDNMKKWKEYRQKLSAASPKTRVITEETKAKIKETSLKNVIDGDNRKKVMIDGVLYESLSAAAKAYDISPQAISYRIKVGHYKGWDFV